VGRNVDQDVQQPSAWREWIIVFSNFFSALSSILASTTYSFPVTDSLKRILEGGYLLDSG
jgi:hypothetical protein